MKERPEDLSKDGLVTDDLQLEHRHERVRPGKQTVTTPLEPGFVDSMRPGKASVSSQLPSAPIMRKVDTNVDVSELGVADVGALIGASGAGVPLPAELQAELEDALGIELGDVRVHTGSRAEQASRAVGARAFAHGRDIYFSAGAFQPDSPAGRELIAHEVAHTTQSPSGTVQGISSPGDSREREADAFASAFLMGPRAAMAHRPMARTPAGILHRDPGDDERLENVTTHHTFRQTQSLEEFEDEVRRYIARRVRSRSTNEATGNPIHREETLFPPGRLRNMYTDADRGGSIELVFEFVSNGYSYREVNVSREMPEEQEPEPDNQDPDQPNQPAQPRQLANNPQRGQNRDDVNREVINILLAQGRDDLIGGVIKIVAGEIFAELFAVIGAIQTMVVIYDQLAELAAANSAEAGIGFAATAYAHQMAEMIWNGRATVTRADVIEAIGHYRSMSGERYRHYRWMGDYMQEKYDAGNERYSRTVASLRRAHQQADNPNTQGERFETREALAAHLVNNAPGERGSTRHWMHQWHTSHITGGRFRCSLARARGARADENGGE